MTSRAEAILLEPAATAGTPTGDGDWRIVTEMWVPQPTLEYDSGYVETEYQSPTWYDLSADCTGVRVVDGASDFGGHLEPSEATVTLRSIDHAWAPWQTTAAVGLGRWLTTGTLIRVSLNDPSVEWHPIFTGEVESAVEQTAGGDVAGIVTVTAIDTVSARLSKIQLVDYVIDDAADGLYCDDIVRTMLSDHAWPYGSNIDFPIDSVGDVLIAAGRMELSGNLLEHLRRMADAGGRRCGVDRYGRLSIVRRRPDIIQISNAYVPVADPNAPDDIALDVAADDVVVDTVFPSPAEDAIINSVTFTNVVDVGIYSPATVGDNVAAVRGVTSANASVRHGLQFNSSQVVTDSAVLFRWQDATATAGGSRLKYGARPIEVADLFPTDYGLDLAQAMADNIVDLYADDMWRIDGVELDNRMVDVIARARVGAAFTLDYQDGEWTGYVGAFEFESTPMLDRCKIAARLDLHAHTFERDTDMAQLIQSGTETDTTTGAGYLTVSFPIGYASTPTVVLSNAYDAAGKSCTANFISRNANGFTCIVLDDSDVATSVSRTVHWVAVGEA